MKTTQSSGTHPVHQTVAEAFQFKINGKAMAISFTDQRLSPQAGSAIFWGWLHRVDWSRRLAAALPDLSSKKWMGLTGDLLVGSLIELVFKFHR